jgi:hypothetical protein
LNGGGAPLVGTEKANSLSKMGNTLSKMSSPRTLRYAEKTSAEARLSQRAPLLQLVKKCYSRPLLSVCEQRGGDQPPCYSDHFFHLGKEYPGCICGDDY